MFTTLKAESPLPLLAMESSLAVPVFWLKDPRLAGEKSGEEVEEGATNPGAPGRGEEGGGWRGGLESRWELAVEVEDELSLSLENIVGGAGVNEDL